jgi:hypothetical protein
LENQTTDMQTLTIEITGNEALATLKALEDKSLIRILSKPPLDLYALHGEPINDEDFKQWVEFAEQAETVSLTLALQRWESQKMKIQRLIH